MKKIDTNLKRILIGIAFGVILYWILANVGHIATGIGYIYGVFKPLFIGCILAFVFNVPMKRIEQGLHKLNHKIHWTLPQQAYRLISFFLTFTIVGLILFFAGRLLIPRLYESVINAIIAIRDKSPGFLNQIKSYGIAISFIQILQEQLQQFLSGAMFKKLLSNTATDVVSMASHVLGTAFQFLLAFIMMIYILFDKERLLRQLKSIVKAYLPSKVANKLTYFAKTGCKVYEDFFTGQCKESVILAALMAFSFWIFKLPYAALIGVLAGITLFIPYVGSFFACGIAVILALLDSPIKALIALIVFAVVQFIENQFIYPKVVGNSVGLPGLWIIVAVLTGGEMFGVIGILFAIPITATIYILLRDNVNKRLRCEKKDPGN